MSLIWAFLAICGALSMGIISPGPSFIFVARTSMAVSRQAGISIALGMGLGSVIFAAVALLGLQALLAGVPTLYLAIKVIGGLYLIYLAFQIWRGADTPLAIGPASPPPEARRNYVVLGLFTQLSNPKTALVYASVFGTLLPRDVPPLFMLLVMAAVFVLEGGWYAIVAGVLSAPRARQTYLKAKRFLDRGAASLLGLLGARFLTDLR